MDEDCRQYTHAQGGGQDRDAGAGCDFDTAGEVGDGAGWDQEIEDANDIEAE